MYAIREQNPNPSVETASVGIQNRSTLSILLLSRLAAKNKSNNKMAMIQNQGERTTLQISMTLNPTEPC